MARSTSTRTDITRSCGTRGRRRDRAADGGARARVPAERRSARGRAPLAVVPARRLAARTDHAAGAGRQTRDGSETAVARRAGRARLDHSEGDRQGPGAPLRHGARVGPRHSPTSRRRRGARGAAEHGLPDAEVRQPPSWRGGGGGGHHAGADPRSHRHAVAGLGGGAPAHAARIKLRGPRPSPTSSSKSQEQRSDAAGTHRHDGRGRDAAGRQPSERGRPGPSEAVALRSGPSRRCSTARAKHRSQAVRRAVVALERKLHGNAHHTSQTHWSSLVRSSCDGTVHRCRRHPHRGHPDPARPRAAERTSLIEPLNELAGAKLRLSKVDEMLRLERGERSPSDASTSGG